jgi:hypothetical protein
LAGAVVWGGVSGPPPPPRNPGLAAISFGLVVAAASAFYLVFGRDKWFFLDEWDYLAGRHLTSVDDLLRPHNEHWSTIPIVVWRLIWQAAGLRAYWPYQIFSIANHLVLAALLRVVMRRAGVGPWIATTVAVVFVCFGAGNHNVIGAFQMQFAGAVTLGVVHLLLADHEGKVDWRDWVGLSAGLAAIMTTSGVGVVMVGVVGLATLIKRGWRIAALHIVPLASVFGVWWLAYGSANDAGVRAGLSSVADFVGNGYAETFVALAWAWPAAVVLLVAIGFGVVLASRSRNDRGVVWTVAGPLALLVGGLVFMALSGWTRGWLGADVGRSSRYLHMIAAFTLPALAVAIEALYRRWQVVGLAALAVLLLGVPANIRRTVDYAEVNPLTLGQPDLVLSLAHSPRITDVPAGVRPFPDDAPDVTAGWLRDNVERGVIPQPDTAPSAQLEAVIALRLGLYQVARPDDAPPCRPVPGPVERTLQRGDWVDFDGLALVTSLDPLVANYMMRYVATVPSRLVAVGATLHVVVSSPVPEIGSLCE